MMHTQRTPTNVRVDAWYIDTASAVLASVIVTVILVVVLVYFARKSIGAFQRRTALADASEAVADVAETPCPPLSA